MSGAVRTSGRGDLAVVHLSGELDLDIAPAVRAELARLADAERTDVVVDLTDVTFMDSTGIGVLVGALKRIRGTSRRMELVVEDPKVLKVLRIAGLNQVFTVHRSLSDAVTAMTDDSAGHP